MYLDIHTRIKVSPMNEKEEKELRQEITLLRNEVKQLRQAVNLLLEMVIEHDDHETFDTEFVAPGLDRNDRFKMGM